MVGEGAQQFAKDHEVPVISNELLQTESSVEAYKVFEITLCRRAINEIIKVYPLGGLASYILVTGEEKW